MTYRERWADAVRDNGKVETVSSREDNSELRRDMRLMSAGSEQGIRIRVKPSEIHKGKRTD